MKPTQKFPIILMGLFALIVSAITIAVISAVEHFGQRQEHQELMAAILQGDETAIKTLERSAPETQRQIIEDERVKNALVHFYLQHADSPLSAISETYEDDIEGHILNAEMVYRTLMAHYYHQIDVEIEADNFKQAFLLLDTLKNTYPHSGEFSDKYEDIQKKKRLRLAILIQKYKECLEQTLAPLLERTHCMAEARQKIELVGIEYPLPSDPNLPAMYAEEIKLALIEKDYEHADTLLLDWQNLLPEASEQRDVLRKRLALHRQIKSIIVDLTGYDNKKLMKRLTQLTIAPELQKEVFKMPQVQTNLLKYHLNEALILMKNPETKIESITKVRLEEALARAPLEAQSYPWYAGSTSQQAATKLDVAELLQQCQAHFQANRLTTGKEGTALDCYRAVLKQEPGNRDALTGLKEIENRYKAWAETALEENNLETVRVHIASIEKVNPKSQILTPLRERLKIAQAQPKPEPEPPAPKVEVNTPQKCEDCDCSALLKQLSVGIKPLTPAEETYFQNQCK
jgi:hypothetical protein